MKFIQLSNKNTDFIEKKKKSTEEKLTSDLKKNIVALKQVLGNSSDMVFREFSFGSNGQIKACLIYLDGMTDKIIINESIIKPLMYDSRNSILNGKNAINIDNIEVVKEAMLSVGGVNITDSISELVEGCMSGETIMLVNNLKEGLVISTRGWAARPVQEAQTETVVRGPRESFNETLRTNTALLRRRVKNPDLTLETMKIGERTKTDVCIAYLKGVVNPKLVNEVKQRLSAIKTDAILESGYIEEFIEDAPFSIFSTVGNSEKPDIVAAKVLEGRVAILVEGTPFVLTVPLMLVESFQSSEDYYSRPYYASLIRILRYICFLITILSPSVYVALITFHQELIPTPLLFTIAASREGVPFPALMETFLMLLVFEILREAGVRLPRPVGQAVSIVGALVLGDSAVAAGLIGTLTVIIVAITAISSFAIPSQTDSSSILRVVILMLGGSMGLFGIAVALLGLLIHLCSLRSFGAPYLTPVAPYTKKDFKDVFIRAPWWAMLTRPRAVAWKESQREASDLKPEPPKSNGNV